MSRANLADFFPKHRAIGCCAVAPLNKPRSPSIQVESSCAEKIHIVLSFDPSMQTVERHVFEDYLLSCTALPIAGGGYQSRVAITALGGQRTRAQRFLDLECFDNEVEALEHARQAGMDWVRLHG